MKLIPGLNFINVLRTALACADPKSVKKTVKLSICFTLLGSMSVKAVLSMFYVQLLHPQYISTLLGCVKAVRRTLMKLIPAVNFINVILVRFSFEFLYKAKTYLEKAAETTLNVDEIDSRLFEWNDDADHQIRKFKELLREENCRLCHFRKSSSRLSINDVTHIKMLLPCFCGFIY